MKTQKIEKLEEELFSKDDWKNKDEIRRNTRGKNALLNEDIEFETAVFNVPISKEINTDVIKYINMRFKEKTFDNYAFIEEKPKIQEETYDIETLETNKEIIELYNEIEEELKKLVDGGNYGFV